MKRFSSAFLLLILFLPLSCERHYAIEERAKKQIMVSMEDELESFSPGMTDWYLEGLKPAAVHGKVP